PRKDHSFRRRSGGVLIGAGASAERSEAAASEASRAEAPKRVDLRRNEWSPAPRRGASGITGAKRSRRGAQASSDAEHLAAVDDLVRLVPARAGRAEHAVRRDLAVLVEQFRGGARAQAQLALRLDGADLEAGIVLVHDERADAFALLLGVPLVRARVRDVEV